LVGLGHAKNMQPACQTDLIGPILTDLHQLPQKKTVWVSADQYSFGRWLGFCITSLGISALYLGLKITDFFLKFTNHSNWITVSKAYQRSSK